MIWLQHLAQDLRFGCRSFLRMPGFTALAVLSLALGIMATTAIYSVLYAVVLDPFPYKDVDSLASVRVWSPEGRGSRTYYSTDQFLEIAERSTIFDGVIASTISDVLWTGGGEPQRLRGNHGTANTFQVMGVPPLAGRFYVPDDVRPGAEPVVVLGYRFWQRQFGGDLAVIGRQLKLNDHVRTVVGVMPKRFMWRGADVYIPVVFERGRMVEGVRTVHLLGRVKAGVTEARAEGDLRPIVDDLAKTYPGQFPTAFRVGLLSFKETFPSSIRQNLWLLFGAVGLLLLIACANVSNLLLSRAAGRQREMAVRSALGGSRGRLVRQLLGESLLLALAAGIIGTAFAYAALGAILALVPPNTIPDESEVALNVPVLLFALLLSLATTVIFGLAPALHTAAKDLANPLRSGGRSVAGGAHAWLRKGLVVSGVALSIVLMVGASLMIRTVVAIGRVDLGFQPERLLTMRVPLPAQKYDTRERRVHFFNEIIRRYLDLPGVEQVGLNTSAHPFGNQVWAVEVPGAPGGEPATIVHQVDAGYMRTLGIAVVKGRYLTPDEVSARRQIAIVNEAFERLRLQGTNAVGRIVRVARLADPPISSSDMNVEIVGVARDTLNRGLTETVRPEMYLPYTLAGAADRLVVRTGGDPALLTKTLIAGIHSMDPDQPVTEVGTIASFLDDFSYSEPRFNVVLLSIFAALGLLLAVTGVYGIMSNMVAQQTREIGVRIALGADPRSVAAMIMKSGGILLAAGIAAGLGGSLFTSRILSQHIWNVAPVDPLSFGGVALLLALAGLQACAWPAWRAARTEPTVALRQD